MPIIPRNETIERKERGPGQKRLPSRGIVTEKLHEEFLGLEIANATSNLTLSNSYQSIVGDGDNDNVRIILPRAGMWLIIATIDFEISVSGAGVCSGALFVDDSGTEEDGEVVFAAALDRITAAQQWVVTTAEPFIPVELQAKKANASGTATLRLEHTKLVAIGGFQ